MSMSFGICLITIGLALEIISLYLSSNVAVILGITMILCGVFTVAIEEGKLREDIREFKEEIQELKKKIK